ncbi:Transcriptional adapter ada2 [Boothiomyces sp. JEL0866]|nr:Transcriptional adapter ada2 [Boothiomyces sp. JEL0866]
MSAIFDYPSPIPSPFLPKSTLIWEAPQNELQHKSKRKNSVPHRSLSPPLDHVDRSFQRIVNLDVYAVFKENPAQLLGKKISDSDSESNPKSPRESVPEPPKPKSTSACKVLPSFIVKNEPMELDLCEYKETKGAPNVSWKAGAQPLPITKDMPEYDDLTAEEVRTCATLRISPKQYIEIKRTMLTAVRSYGPFKKREAQTWFRIDVNKICIIYDWFKALQWIPSTDDWVAPADSGRRGSFSEHRQKKLKRK